MTDVRAVQFWNAPKPSVLTLLGTVTLVMLLLANASQSTAVTELGIVTLDILHWWNACAAIFFTG